MLKHETELGTISFSENVILKVIKDAIASCGGKVELCNYRGRYKNVIPGSEDVILHETDEGLEIAVYVVMKFGSSIRGNSKKIINYTSENIEKMLGEKPHKLRVVVTGVKSKTTARRHIVIGG